MRSAGAKGRYRVAAAIVALAGADQGDDEAFLGGLFVAEFFETIRSLTVKR